MGGALARASRCGKNGVVIAFLIFAIILVAQVEQLLKSGQANIAIGLAGGAFLAWMGAQILLGLRKGLAPAGPARARHPFVSGVVLSAGNPYFLLWWATVGLALASEARLWGVMALGVFAVIHWLCDLLWLEALSLATFHGSRVVGARAHKVFLGLCAIAILYFAETFLWDAGRRLWDAIMR
jgi:threonine/homoserine/homoserine lactone efflux protein